MAIAWARLVPALAVLGGLALAPTHLDAAGSLTLVDHSGAVGLAATNESFHAAPADIDADGDEDVLIGYHDQGSAMWRNDGGTFMRISPTSWRVRVDRHDCAWGDANGDGRLDAHCSVGRTGANKVKSATTDNELWLQGADGTFTDVGTEWGIGDPYGRGRATTFIDANGDAHLDLFVGNKLPRPDDADGGADGENKLFLNDGGHRFVRAPQFGLDVFAGADCALPFDVDGDGWDDLLVCGDADTLLYRNLGGTGFAEVGSSFGLTTAVSRDADLEDLDADGDLDFIAVSGKGVRYQLFGDGRFGPVQWLRDDPDAQGVAVADADGDGDGDVFVVLGNDTANPDDILYLNEDMTFRPITAPSAGGRADGVAAIDVFGDGSEEFIVMNGREIPGPVQVLRLTDGSDATPTPTPGMGTSILENSSFEADADGDGAPDSWTENDRFRRSATLVRTGSWSGRHAASDNRGYEIRQEAAVTAGRSYRVSAWVNVPPTDDAFTLHLKVQWRGSSGAITTATVGKAIAATSGWMELTRTLTAPAGATTGRVRMIAKSLNATIYVDDVALRSAD